jgi:hypothetical protein
MAIFAERKKQDDFNDPFGNESYAYYESEENDSEQRIYEEIDCSQTVQAGYERMPSKGAASEMNPEGEMSNGRENKEPT